MAGKLQKQLAYKYKGKKHFKHVLVIPEDTVNKLGWKVGQKMELTIENSHLIVKPKTEDDRDE
jgi:hypothetical protein